MEKNTVIPQKIKHGITIWVGISTSDTHPKQVKAETWTVICKLMFTALFTMAERCKQP